MSDTGGGKPMEFVEVIALLLIIGMAVLIGAGIHATCVR